ncbi:MAG: tRNA lysidine(34) synthetase [Thermodesulfobacteriota bacterium]
MSTSLYREINRGVGRAIHRYDMIADGDRIVIGISGGKDSLTLMQVLTERLARIPISYELVGVYVDPGFENGFGGELAAYCQEKGFRLKVIHTDNGIVAHGPANRENPCFLCSRLRRKVLFETAAEMGFGKIALAHHKDDLIETLLMNMCYTGEISTMRPVRTLFDGRLAIIRPLAFVDEDVIRRFARREGFPEFINPCPTASVSKRREIKDLLTNLYRSNRKIKGNLFRSMTRIKTDYLPI